MVSGESFGSSVVSLACITSLCSVQCFRGGHSLCLAFGSIFYSHPSPPLNFPLLNRCDGCLVPLEWGLKAGGRGFASHGGITLSRGWPCQRWKPLDIPGTHLHSATQLLIIYETIWLIKETFILPVQIKTTTIKWLRYHIIPLFPFHQCTGCYLPEGLPVQKTCIHYSWQFWNDWN